MGGEGRGSSETTSAPVSSGGGGGSGVGSLVSSGFKLDPLERRQSVVVPEIVDRSTVDPGREVWALTPPSCSSGQFLYPAPIVLDPAPTELDPSSLLVKPRIEDPAVPTLALAG